MWAVFLDRHFRGYLQFRVTSQAASMSTSDCQARCLITVQEHWTVNVSGAGHAKYCRNKSILESYHPRIQFKFVNTLLRVYTLAFGLGIPLPRFSCNAFSRFVNDQSDARQQDQPALNGGWLEWHRFKQKESTKLQPPARILSCLRYSQCMHWILIGDYLIN